MLKLDNEILAAVKIKTKINVLFGFLALLSCHLLFSDKSFVVMQFDPTTILNHDKPH